MTKIYPTCDWGILVTQGNATTTGIKDLEDAGFQKIIPVAKIIGKTCEGYVYFNQTGEYRPVPQEPFWFYPLMQSGLFDAAYCDIHDVLKEVKMQTGGLLSEEAILARLVKLNAIVKEDA